MAKVEITVQTLEFDGPNIIFVAETKTYELPDSKHEYRNQHGKDYVTVKIIEDGE